MLEEIDRYEEAKKHLLEGLGAFASPHFFSPPENFGRIVATIKVETENYTLEELLDQGKSFKEANKIMKGQENECSKI